MKILKETAYNFTTSVIVACALCAAGGTFLCGKSLAQETSHNYEDTSRNNGEAAELTEDPILEKAAEAERLYQEGIETSKDGKHGTSKRRIRKAFKILASVLAEERLSAEFQPEFEAMTEKLKAMKSGEGAAKTPGLLEVSEEEFQQLSTTSTIKQSPGRNYTIAIATGNKLTQKFLAIYTRDSRRATALRALERSGRYRNMIMAALKEAELPRELFYLAMVESEFHPTCRSRAGALGLWQFMPATARRYGLKVNYWIDERRDPEKSTHAALKYLKFLRDWFDDWHLALAAYNRGEHGLGRDMKFSKATDFSQLSKRSSLPRETNHFVPKFMACVLIGDSPHEYGFYPDYEAPRQFDTVTLDKPLDLDIAAKCAGTTRKVIKDLNPAITAWCTPKNYPGFKLKIPTGSRDMFLAKLAVVKDWNPSRGVIRYRVRSGDILGKLARRYRTTVGKIMRDNKIRNARRLRTGRTIVIRPGRNYFK